MVLVEARQLGQKRALVPEWAVPIPVGPDAGSGSGHDAGLTLRELIARLVRAEVDAFEGRQRARRLVRALSPAELASGEAAGRIAPGGRELLQPVDADVAVGIALAAFEDGLYKVFVDGTEQTDLERELFLRDDSRVTFLRLVFLAGA